MSELSWNEDTQIEIRVMEVSGNALQHEALVNLENGSLLQVPRIRQRLLITVPFDD
jgi:hypothetical protein